MKFSFVAKPRGVWPVRCFVRRSVSRAAAFPPAQCKGPHG